MKDMKRSKLEPGLLQVFRWLVAGQLILLLLSFFGQYLQADPWRLRYPLLGIMETGLLLLYLTWPWLRRQLGRFYLPIALSIASVGPIVTQALTVALRVRRGVPGVEATTDAWRLILVLFIPLILVAWQYDFGSVIAFSIGTTALDIFLMVALAVVGRFRPGGVIGLILIRMLLFALVGYIVARLMRDQRAQRRALAEANARLTRYSSTLEQLAISQERNRLARELHDTLAHSLSAVAVQLEAMRSVWDEDPIVAREMLDRSLHITRQGLGETRRAIRALRSTPLEDLGLALALGQLAESVAQRAGLALTLDLPERVDTLPPEVEQGVYRIAAEAMENVARHAEATRLVVRLEWEESTLTLMVEDDGRGFDTGAPPLEGRYGLQGMRERAKVIGGELSIESRPDEGTVVKLVVGGTHGSRSDL
jgi:signal transduction histidine kinase